MTTLQILKIMYSNLSMREPDQDILNFYIQLNTNTGRIEELEIEDQEELIIFEKLKEKLQAILILLSEMIHWLLIKFNFLDLKLN